MPKASFKNWAILYSIDFLSEANKALIFFNVCHDWCPKYSLRISVYLVQQSNKAFEIETIIELRNDTNDYIKGQSIEKNTFQLFFNIWHTNLYDASDNNVRIRLQCFVANKFSVDLVYDIGLVDVA